MQTNYDTIRTAVDPHDTLPPVELIKDDDQPHEGYGGSAVATVYGIYADDERIGGAIITNDSATHQSWFNDVEIIDEAKRGQGYGTAAYIAAIELAHARGNTFRTHEWSQSEFAKRVWERFVDAKVAEVVEPFHAYGRGGQGRVHYTGHLRVPPTKNR